MASVKIGKQQYLSTRDDVLIFNKLYDPNQLWFPFVYAIYKNAIIEPKTKNHKKITNLIKSKLADKIQIPETCRHIYVPVKGEHQMVLPFSEIKAVSVALGHLLRYNDYPAFERDSNNKLYKARYIAMYPYKPNALRKWIIDNAYGRVDYKGHGGCIFEYKDDYNLAILSGLFA